MRIPARRRSARVVSLGAPLVLLPLAGMLLRTQGGPPYSPEDALKTFRLADGFQIELVAAEPLLADPVAMEVDEYGRIYVVEMPGYPLDTSGSGRVLLLSDSDGDGRADGSTVFAEGLRLPTGVMRWKKGVLVTDSPEVWYLEDTDGDGRADVKDAVLTGFALSNPQHNTSAPIYGLDNWIYLANEGPVRTTRFADQFGDPGRDVHFPARPAGPRLPPDAAGRNVRFRPDGHQLEMLSARSQFGQTFDAWGNHFLVSNARPIYQEVIAARYLARNPALAVPSITEQTPGYRLPAQVFPITRQPEFQLLTDVGVMTSASGLTWYLADLFPAEYRDAAFVAEAAHNLVHVDTVRPHGSTFRASRLFEGKEFLASTDAWFRPVNFYVGPDGALYVIDYYRRILEHPEWMDDATAGAGELYSGQDRGRIYRITPTGTPRAGWIGKLRLGDATAPQLVQALEHPNVWWRRHAQRLLVDRKPAAAVRPLTALATRSASPAGRVHALWTLEGLGRLDRSAIAAALRDSHPGVRENAIRLAELHLRREPGLAPALLAMETEPDARVRLQLLLTLGELGGDAAEGVRSRLLFANVEDGWMQVAALSASRWRGAELLQEALERLAGGDTPGRRTLLSRIGATIGGTGDMGEIRRTAEMVAMAAAPADSWWRVATLEGLAGGLRGERARAAELNPVRERLAALLLANGDAAVNRAALGVLETIGLPDAGAADQAIAGQAERVFVDRAADPEARANAIRLLAMRGRQHEPLIVSALGRGEPEAVQLAAVRALDRIPGDRHAAAFLSHWPEWSPAVRLEAARALARDPARVPLLLEALASRRVDPAEIDRPLRNQLTALSDETLRARARAIFAVTTASGLDAVERYRAILSVQGDPARGAEVFARVCSSCHQYRGAGGTPFGPDLGEVSSHLPFSLLTDILHPNQSIADGFELWQVKLTDGTTLSGIISSETPTSVTLRRAGSPPTTLPRAQIASMAALDLSAMPEGLDAQVTPDGMAHLLAYLKAGR
ncbi:MAG: c-type cytochrome [Gemmatimonadetes bacterium]|nr:c-type cytochrome [Gemmatimonadota bacterium]